MIYFRLVLIKIVAFYWNDHELLQMVARHDSSSVQSINWYSLRHEPVSIKLKLNPVTSNMHDFQSFSRFLMPISNGSPRWGLMVMLSHF